MQPRAVAGGEAEQRFRGPADHRAKGLVTCTHVPADVVVLQLREVAVRLGVVAHHVAGVRDRLRDRRVAPHERAGEEERGRDVLALERGEDAVGGRRRPAAVERDRDDAARRGQRLPVLTEPRVVAGVRRLGHAAVDVPVQERRHGVAGDRSPRPVARAPERAGPAGGDAAVAEPVDLAVEREVGPHVPELGRRRGRVGGRAGEPVQEGGHGVPVDGLGRAELAGPVRASPPRRDAPLGRPDHRHVVLGRGRHVRERRLRGQRHGGGAGQPVQERRHRVPVHRGVRTELPRPVGPWPAGGDALFGQPRHLRVEGGPDRYVHEPGRRPRRHGGNQEAGHQEDEGQQACPRAWGGAADGGAVLGHGAPWGRSGHCACRTRFASAIPPVR